MQGWQRNIGSCNRVFDHFRACFRNTPDHGRLHRLIEQNGFMEVFTVHGIEPRERASGGDSPVGLGTAFKGGLIAAKPHAMTALALQVRPHHYGPTTMSDALRGSSW